MAIIAGISQGFAAVANIIILIAMCWSLRPAHYPDMLQPEGVFENLVVLFVCHGLGLVIIHLMYLGTFVALPGKPYWIAVQMVAPRVYTNAVLGLLNTWEVKHGVGLNEEETLSDRHESQNDPFPGQLRFHDIKTTQQSLSFLRQGETGWGSEIEEARKSYGVDRLYRSPLVLIAANKTLMTRQAYH
ncbi:uncharacterized protein EDB93DRAFT_1175178, partial [Suillus bovinus]|uniref:uncharacterized protein n=1 Tax=Suillus bovinus TaxID=48563 RepID=UPI001B862822